jgi:hypothetical protein
MCLRTFYVRGHRKTEGTRKQNPSELAIASNLVFFDDIDPFRGLTGMQGHLTNGLSQMLAFVINRQGPVTA